MTWHKTRPTRLSLSVAMIATFMGCGGAQQRSDSQLLDAHRERDALRVAYEAQQLKLKELSERVIALEDRVMLSAAPKTSGRGTGLWGRPLTARVPVGLPVVKLSEMGVQSRQDRRASSLKLQEKRSASAPPSAQEMRAERLEEAGERLDELPTLTADNIKGYQRARRVANGAATKVDSLEREQRSKRKRSRRTHPAPEGSERAASLGVVPVPPRPRGAALKAQPAVAPAVELHDETDHEVLSERQSEARAELARARREQDPFAEALREAQTALLKAKWTEARRSFEQVLSLSPKAEERSSARYGIARVLRGQGRPLEAIDMLKSLIQADPSGRIVPRALLLIAELQLSTGQTAQGRATLSRLRSLYPNTSAAQRAEGLLQ